MRHNRKLPIVIALAFGWFLIAFGAVGSIAGALAGCSSTPIAETPVGENAIRYQQAVGLYATAVQTMTSLNDARVITLQQAEEFEQVRASASRLLTEWRASVVAREPFNGWNSLESLIEEMIRLTIEGDMRPVAVPTPPGRVH